MIIRKPYAIIVAYMLFSIFKMPDLNALNTMYNVEEIDIIKSSISDYISIYRDYSMDLMEKYNMPASVILAQGILESDAGNSDIATSFNNHFNILCDDTLPKDNCYKNFENPIESFENHVLLMKESAKYNSLFEKKDATYNEWAYGLAKFGNKSETYVRMIIYYIEKYRIYDYDLQVRKEIEADKQKEIGTDIVSISVEESEKSVEITENKTVDKPLVLKGDLTKKKNVKSKTNISLEEYITSYENVAMELMKTYKMPASIILAQGIVESNNGNNSLAIDNNNHFGILCDGTLESEECYKKFTKATESFEAHVAQLVQDSKYTKLFAKAKNNYIKWAYGLKKYGYATDKNYPKRLIYYIEKYKLYQLDDKVRNKKLRRATKKDKYRALNRTGRKYQMSHEELNQQVIEKDSIIKEQEDKYLKNELDKDDFKQADDIIKQEDSVEKIVVNSNSNAIEADNISNQQENSLNKNLLVDSNSNKDNDIKNNQNDNESKVVEFDGDNSIDRTKLYKKEDTTIYESAYYIVKAEDTYYNIAKRYGISVRFLKELNNATSNLIIIGQSLKVVGDLPDYKIHNIVKGDTLYSLARRYGVTVAYLSITNNIEDENLIYIGDILKY